MAEKPTKEKKPGNQSTKQVLLVLAKKIKIMDEQALQMRVLLDELEDRVTELEARVYDGREPFFKQDPTFDWGDD